MYEVGEITLGQNVTYVLDWNEAPPAYDHAPWVPQAAATIVGLHASTTCVDLQVVLNAQQTLWPLNVTQGTSRGNWY